MYSEYRPGGVVRAVFFSPTGTTRTVVSLLAPDLAAELSAPLESYDFCPPSRRPGAHPAQRPAGCERWWACRSMRQLPNVLLPYLEQWEGWGALAVPVVLFGDRNFDDALIELRDLLEQRGYHTLAGAAFVGEHAFPGRWRPAGPTAQTWTRHSALPGPWLTSSGQAPFPPPPMWPGGSPWAPTTSPGTRREPPSTSGRSSQRWMIAVTTAAAAPPCAPWAPSIPLT